MKVFIPEESATAPRADMFLPNWLLGFGIALNVLAVACLLAALTSQMWGFIAGFAILGALGIAALLCWKNQSIRIIDDYRFEYTTFLGRKTTYYFSEIKKLRVNQDSFTLFVGDGKVHIESCAVISKILMDKIDAVLEKNGEGSTYNN